MDYGKLCRMTQKPFRILQLIPTMQSGGAEQSCIDVTAALTQAGHVAFVATQGGRWSGEIIRAGGKIIHLPLKKKNPLTIWRNAKKLEKIIRDHKIDLVHARSRAPAWSGYFAAKKTGIPFMTTFHAAYKFSSKLKQRYNSVMAKGVRVIAISQYIAQHILDHYHTDPSRLRIIYRGTPLERFHPNMIHSERLIKLAREWQVPEDKHLILMPSRLTRIKGHHILIEALAKLNRDDYFCIICGATPDREHYQEELHHFIAQHGLKEKIRIVGICSDMPAALRLAQLVVAPSLVPEGFGRIPVEAQAMGTPVVASAIGGHKEVVIDGETGFLVPPDDADAMAAAMNKALDMNPAERQMMGNNAMNFVSQHFGKEQMTSQTLAVYDEILSGG
ncbi:MAG: glycosyl transferase [Alphaproteobacteria bacterium]|nr:glycosyl transferase [Alphaproteobacteria bacterium]